MRARRFTAAAVVLLAACSSTTSDPTGSADPTTFAMEVASGDLYAGPPQRVQVGIFHADETVGVRLLTSGELDLTISQAEGSSEAITTPARYVPAPGTDAGDGSPTLTSPDVARGVYQADDVTFGAAGVWETRVAFDIEGQTIELSTSFTVATEPALPAPGQQALATKTLTLDSKVDPQAIDSRALDGAPVPDPELHEATIAGAMEDGRPVLVLFATPVYCQSQFCGPTVEALEELGSSGPSSVAYIHVEIWHDYQASEINKGAADWLLRGGDLTEPWLFLIDGGGVIVDRWGPLFDPDEVLTAVEAVTT